MEKLPRELWLIALYRVYAWMHGFPDPYRRAGKLFAGMRRFVHERRMEADRTASAEYYATHGARIAMGMQNAYGTPAYMNMIASQLQAAPPSQNLSALHGLASGSLGLLGLGYPLR